MSLIFTVALVLLALGSTISAGAALSGGEGRTAGSASPKCAPNASCVTIPCATSKCPSVVAEPVTNLEQNQWVYLNLSNFPAGSEAEIYLCSDKVKLTATAKPYCVVLGSAVFQYPNQELPIFPDGTSETSFHVEGDPHTKGDVPFNGQIPYDSSSPKKTFFCDDSANRCSIDVWDWTLLKETPAPPEAQPSDTAIVPLNFAPSSDGCARGPSITTTSDYSIEELIPSESPVACKDKLPAVPYNTAALNSEGAVSDLASGATVAFVDDPQDPVLQQALAATGGHYAVIPIVSSAVVVGYQAAMQSQGQIMYPFHDFELTPNMAAGLLTYNYQFPYGSDVVKCPLPTMAAPCSALEDLNSVPTYTPAGTYGAFIPSIVSGVTENLTDWLCHAPNKPFMLDGKLVNDPNTAAHTLTHGTYEKPWPIKTCTTFDQFPPLKSPSDGIFNLVSDPSHQVKYLRAFAPPASFQFSPTAGFAPMDWGDARLNGLDVASLQNADGQFVEPDAKSVTAEISAWKLSPAGYPIPDYTKAVNGGYPMSTVIDAIVPTDPQSKVNQSDISEMLDDLLAYTTNPKNVLPDGYVALPSSLAKSAKAELAAALSAEKGSTTTTTTTTTSPGVTPTTSPTVPVTTTTGTTPKNPGGSKKSGGQKNSTKPGTLDASQVALVASESRLALPAALAAGLLLIVLSLTLSAYGRVRRRRGEVPGGE
ncbi:MAG: hypothetical protein ACLPQS_08320 [Acidimicrobiales bacterium]